MLRACTQRHQPWRTLLLGQTFEIYSDHDSLQYLFTQKSPSQRILRWCECLADFDFEEIKYVPGSHIVVPDFLSRRWGSAEVDVPPAIHTLAACTARRTKKTAGPMPVPHASMARLNSYPRKTSTKRIVVSDDWVPRDLI